MKKKGIVEIVSVLLLILVAIAAITVVYAYVIGLVGTLTSNTITTPSIISIDNACVSSEGRCASVSGQSTYAIVVRNIGSLSISITAANQPQVYLTDASSGSSYSASCNAPTAIVAQGQTFTCFCQSSCPFSPQRGDTIMVKIVDPDGGSAITSTKAL